MKTLKIAACTYQAAKYACLNYHYSKAVPAGKLIKYGVWENDMFIGAVLFGRGATLQIGDPYNLTQHQICELVRVALNQHEHHVTEIISKCLKKLHQDNPSLELVVSYADKNQDHLGTIYQAGNWIYEGYRKVRPSIIIHGKKIHARTVYTKYGHNGIEWLKKNVDVNAHYAPDKGRYKYIYPLTKRARKKYAHLHKPYPKQ